MNLATPHRRTRYETGLLTGLWCLTVLLLWGLAALGIEALSVSRSYTAMAATWSVSQRDAAFHVTQYAASHDAGDYADFLTAAKQPAGARRALAELASPHPNPAVARAAFLESGLDEHDVDEILRSAGVVRRLGFSKTFLARRIALDTELQELRHLASLLHAQITLPEPSRMRLGTILSEIHDTKHRVNILEAEFAADVSRISRRVKTAALTVISVTAISVLGLGVLLVTELAARIRQSEAARVTVEPAPRAETGPRRVFPREGLVRESLVRARLEALAGSRLPGGPRRRATPPAGPIAPRPVRAMPGCGSSLNR